jgi:hypothetical protein
VAVLWYDQETRLLYDDTSWYLEDGKTVVEEVPGTDLFAGKDGTRYRRGAAVLWYDPDTRLLYDDTSWYLEDGRTVVEEVPGTDLFADKDGRRYRLGELIREAAEQPGGDQSQAAEQHAEERLFKALSAARDRRLTEAITALRAAGVSPASLPDEQIAKEFDELAAQAWPAARQ